MLFDFDKNNMKGTDLTMENATVCEREKNENPTHENVLEAVHNLIVSCEKKHLSEVAKKAAQTRKARRNASMM